MKEQGYRDVSVDDYLTAIRLYLQAEKNTSPSIEDAKAYHSNMAQSNLARSTYNGLPKELDRDDLAEVTESILDKALIGE
jgi:hypothetical protein